jgi:hypothetical protein
LVTLGTEREACSRVRLLQYRSHLEARGFTVRIEAFYPDRRRASAAPPALLRQIGAARHTWARVRYLSHLAAQHDVVVWQRVLPPRWLQRQLRRHTARLLFDFDDAIYTTHIGADPVPPDVDARFQHMLRMSDMVLASTPPLAARARRHQAHVLEIPSPVDCVRLQPRTSERTDGRVVIGWIGSPATTMYLEPVLPVLRKIVAARQRVGVTLVGANLAGDETIRVVPWSLESECRDIQQFDIGIMPLTDDEWARGKGGYKLLQYMACGLPSVASDVGINSAIVRHGETGIIARDLAQWEAALLALVDSAEQRRAMGARARARAEAEYSVARWAPVFCDAVATAVTTTNGTRNASADGPVVPTHAWSHARPRPAGAVDRPRDEQRRVVVFDEIAGDVPQSYQVFLADFLAHLEAADVPYHVVRPRWRVPGSRSGFGHVAASAVCRQLCYPFWARRAIAQAPLAFFVSTGLAHALWMAPRHRRVVMFCHDVFAFLDDERLGHQLDFGGAWRARYLSLVQKPMIRRARLILVPSEQTRRDLVETVGVHADRIVIVPHRVDATVFRPGDRATARLALGLPPDAPVILAIVTPERRKNIDRLLDALTLVVAQRPTVRVVLVGDLQAGTEAACEHGVLKGHVHRHRHVSLQDMVRLYRSADCLAHVSLYEGFGYPLLEAMSCGCPVVSSYRGAAAEVVADAAERVDPLDPADIARGIDRVLADADHRAVLIERGLSRAQTFATPRDYVRVLAEAWRP